MPLPAAADTGLPAVPVPREDVLVLLNVCESFSFVDARLGLIGWPGSWTILPVWNMARRSSQVDMFACCVYERMVIWDCVK